MPTKVGSGMTSGVVKESSKASKTATSTSASKENEVVQLNSSGKIPTAYYDAGGGISEWDKWRFTTNADGDQNPFKTNLARQSGDGFNLIGSGMAVDAATGLWTFPSTGLWLVRYTLTAKLDSADGDSRLSTMQIQLTTDGTAGSLNGITNSQFFMQITQGGETLAQPGACQVMIDITDVSNYKIALTFEANLNANVTVMGGTHTDNTSFEFIKLGET